MTSREKASIRDLPGWPGKVLGYFRDPRVATWRKLLGLFAVVYTAWPLDAIPDVVPGLGWLDDIGLLGLAVTWMVRDIRRHAARTPHV